MPQLPVFLGKSVHPTAEVYSEYPSSANVTRAPEEERLSSTEPVPETTPTCQIDVDDPAVMECIWGKAKYQRQLKKRLGCEDVQWDGALLVIQRSSDSCEELEKRLYEFCDKFTSKKLLISTSSLWEKSKKFIEEEVRRRDCDITCCPLEGNTAYQFAGLETEVIPFYQYCANKISNWQSELEEETSEVKETISVQSHDHLLLMQRTKSYKDIPEDVRLSERQSESKAYLDLTGPKSLVSKVKEDLMQTLVSIELVTVGFDDRIAKFLRKKSLGDLNQHFSDSGVDALATGVEETSTRILAFASARVTAKDLAKSRYACVLVEGASDDQMQSFMRSVEYKQFATTLCMDNDVLIEPDYDAIRESIDPVSLSVTGEKAAAHDAAKTLTSFLMGNVIFTELLDLDHPGYAKVLTARKGNTLESLMAKWKTHRAEIVVSQRDENVTLKATKVGIKHLMDGVRNLIEDIKFQEVEYKSHGLVRFLRSRVFSSERSEMEKQNQALVWIDGEEEDGDSSSAGGRRLESGSSVKLKDFTVPRHPNKRISLYKGDICRHRADAIVNAANEELQHVGGVAKHIADCAGRGVQQQCAAYIRDYSKLPTGNAMITDAGRLKTTSHIIHAVGPKWFGDQLRDSLTIRNVEMDMKQAVKSSLELASRKKCKSIAFPAIGAGIYRCPSPFVAKHMVKTAAEYLSEIESGSLSEVHFVLLEKDKDNISCFSEQMERDLNPVFSLDPSLASSATTDAFRRPFTPPVQGHTGLRQVPIPTVSQNVQISVKPGDITSEEVRAFFHMRTVAS